MAKLQYKINSRAISLVIQKPHENRSYQISAVDNINVRIFLKVSMVLGSPQKLLEIP